MKLSQRNKRQRITFIELDSNGDNQNGFYTGVSYIGLQEYELRKVIFVNGTQLFIADVDVTQ